MKRFSIIKKLAGITAAALIAFGAAGCSNLDSSENDIALLVSSQATNYGRVALSLPESTEEKTYTFSKISLKYQAEGAAAKSLGSWETSQELEAAEIKVPVGKYTFTLSAVVTIKSGENEDTDSYSGTTEGEVTDGGTTTLEFSLKRGAAATTDDVVTKGTANDDGTYTIIKWVASEYNFSSSEKSETVSGTFGDVTVSSGKAKSGQTYIQLSKNAGALKFVVPANTSKIVVNAKVGSTKLTSCSMTVQDSNAVWSKTESVSAKGSDGNQTYADYTFEPTFTALKDDDGNEINAVTVLVKNTDSASSLNINSVTVYAPTSWTVSTSETKISSKTTSENAATYETKSADVKVDLAADTTATTQGSSITVKEAAGWLNSAYVIFNDSADSYTITCDGAKVDDELLRHYSTYKYYTNSYSDGQTTWKENLYSNVCRVDVLGLKAGEHTISITPKDGVATTVTATVINHDRSGFAFTSDTTPGAYNMDGTLKSNAKVIYVTKDNAKTVSIDITNSKGVTTTYTGLQQILENSTLKTSASDLSLDIRIIGKVSLSDLDYIASSAEGLQVKSNVNAGKKPVPITIEGVGHDATIWGFGLMARDSSYVEFANLGIMCFLDDGISLDTGNMYAWVHNVDLFYGSTGGDSDQAKGDGSLDVKGNSQNNTYSYVHFWDSGKSSLCGMKSEKGPNYLTYHHNWFDHSDSRHPRIRTMSVHIYNNYFDGNAKYGVGVTTGASAFVEQNIFRNPHDPMMSSGQGTDAVGDGTFSGESGGIIKAYNNLMFDLGLNGVKFQYMTNKDEGWTSSDNDIDAYIVDNRSDTVPSTLKTVSGGTTYDNFDTVKGDTGLGLTNAPQLPANALNSVVKYAGRHNPDFAWTFNNAEQDSNYSLIKELKSALVNYTNTGLASE